MSNQERIVKYSFLTGLREFIEDRKELSWPVPPARDGTTGPFREQALETIQRLERMRTCLYDLIKARDDVGGEDGEWVFLATGLIDTLRTALTDPEPLRHYQAAAAFIKEVEEAKRHL